MSAPVKKQITWGWREPLFDGRMNYTKHIRLNAIAMLLSAALLILSGCGGGSSTPAGSQEEDGTVSITPTLTALLVQSVDNDSGTNTLSANAATQQTFSGTLTAFNTATAESTSVFWSAFVDDVTLEVESNSTLILVPGTYNLTLLISQGAQQYAGTITAQSIVEGTNTISMVLRPVIGDTIMDVNLVSLTGKFNFQYSVDELSNFTNPRLGVIIDGGAEEVFTIDPLSGSAGTMLANLALGQHTLHINFYEGNLQRGKSRPEQEIFIVDEDRLLELKMDLVPLTVEMASAADADGVATFQFLIPPEVVEEAGGLDRLQALFLVAGPASPPLQQEVLLALSLYSDNFNYYAQVVLDGFKFGDVTLGIIFSDNNGTPENFLDDQLIGICIEENVLISTDQTPTTTLCGVDLLRRDIIGGNLMATLAVNVSDTSPAAVPGAVIKANGKVKSITGTGAFGRLGFSLIFVKAGTFTIEAVKTNEDGSTTTGTATIEIDPLVENSLDIVVQ